MKNKRLVEFTVASLFHVGLLQSKWNKIPGMIDFFKSIHKYDNNHNKDIAELIR